MTKIGIIITTFMRDTLSYEAINSIIKFWNINYEIFYGNQSYQTDNERVDGFSNFNIALTDPARLSSNHVNYYNLPFDCGLSYARNYLVQRAKEKHCRYCLIMADSLHINSYYDFTDIINFLESDNLNGIIGFDIKQRISWEYDLELISNQHFILKKPRREKIVFNNIRFQPIDICRNFFLAKTDCLLDVPWDNELKLCEHEDFFYRLKQSKWKIYWTDKISCDYKTSKNDVYKKYRNRLYNEFNRFLKKKYALQRWVKYER